MRIEMAVHVGLVVVVLSSAHVGCGNEAGGAPDTCAEAEGQACGMARVELLIALCDAGSDADGEEAWKGMICEEVVPTCFGAG